MSYELNEEALEAMARAIYACNPICEQPTDLDGVPCGTPGEVPFDSLYEYDAGLWANTMDAARAAWLAGPGPAAMEALRNAEVWFGDYERQHLLKGTPDGDAKARTNAERAEVCRQALGCRP